MKNLQLLIQSADKVGSLKTWAFYAIDKKYWIKLIKTFRITSENFVQLSPLCRNIPLLPSLLPLLTPLSLPRNINSGLGTNIVDSMAFLGFNVGFNSKERDVIITYRKLARKYHLDKNDPLLTGLNNDQATAFFQTLNNAFSYVRANKNL